MLDARTGLRCPIDAHQIIERLWQGSFPEPGGRLRSCGFDVLVLCAEELQPPSDLYQGVEVIHAGIDDGLVTPELERTARRAANRVVKAHRDGKRILVTCAQGRNRSGLVVGFVLKELAYRTSPDVKVAKITKSWDVVDYIQRRRPNALTNPYFVELLRRRYVEWLSWSA